MKFSSIFKVFLCLFATASCKQQTAEHAGITRIGTIENIEVDEASGIQPGLINRGVYYVHNDDGKPVVFAQSEAGKNLGGFQIEGAGNRDWEDMTAIPSPSGDYILLADIGDNFAIRDSVQLYFVKEPTPAENGRFTGKVPLHHSITLEYPDGSRDSESIAFDSSSNTIYVMSKRDKPARLYSIPLKDALETDKAVLRFESEVARFRPASAKDSRKWGKKESKWISQPTGMDINRDGSEAVVITYRSIYLFRKGPGESWPEAFSRQPVEFIGPPDRNEEAVAYSQDGASIIVTAEGVRAPIYRFRQIGESH